MVKKNIFIIVTILSFTLIACGKKQEKLEPIYQPEALVFKEISIKLDSTIPYTEIDNVSFPRKVVRALFSGFPIIGGLFELPLDATNALLPSFHTISHPELPKEGDWRDPNFLKQLDSLRLSDGYIRLVPKNELPQDYVPEENCFLGILFCKPIDYDNLDLTFLKNVYVYLSFSDDGNAFNVTNAASDNDQPNPKVLDVLLAQADITHDYDAREKKLNFRGTGEDLRPYLIKYPYLRAKISAKADIPEYKVSIDGKLFLELQLKVNH